MCPPPPVWDARTGKTRNAAYEDGRLIANDYQTDYVFIGLHVKYFQRNYITAGPFYPTR